ncbi:MAG: phosphonate metabolism protein/1,5-bisphosphokinase (PRPP-forming) PhnN [Parvibaculaceae bacterium]
MTPLPGRLVLVVGPSGAGKDSLLRHAARRLADEPRIVFPRRAITRAACDAAEDHVSLTVEEFRAAEARGDFVLSWEAHGLHYGISAAIRRDLAAGRAVAVNVSRAVIAEAKRRFPNMAVLHVTAPASVLAERLARRGRETAADIARRIGREPAHFESGVETVTIVNDASLDRAAMAFTTALLSFAGASCAAPVRDTLSA